MAQLTSAASVDTKHKKSILARLNKEKELWFLSAIAIVWLIIFAYVPMYGLIYSFYKYVPGKKLADCKFVGLDNFEAFFRLPDAGMVIRNTLVISGLGLTIGFVAPIILALLFDELKNVAFKRVAQTVSYLPYFVSWVVVASIITSVAGNEGSLNEALMAFGFIEKPIDFLGEGKYFWALITIANIWKGIGWSTILYMSAIAGIDQELYQAGAVDGLGRFGMVWHITLPGILPTIVLLFVLGCGNILSAGFEQQLLLGRPTTREYYEVIDTYVYRYGIQLGRYSFATAVGFMKSIIGLVLVFITNGLSKKLTDMSIL